MSYDPYNQQPLDPYNQYNQPQGYQERPAFPTRGADIRVLELLVIPTGTYQEQYRRPFVTDLNNNNLSQVYDVVSQAYRDFKIRKDSGSIHPNEQYMIDPMTLAPVSSSFIMPAARAEAPARLNMLHGLHQQTARFMMTIQVQRHGAVEPQIFVLVGYTNFMGIIQKHGRAGLNNSDYALDPQMEMTINSVLEVRKVQRDYGYGPQIAYEMQSIHQVLIDSRFTGVDQAEVVRMRPYEVASALARMNDPKIRQTGVTTTDTRYMQTATPEFSDVHNTNPNNYMAKIIGGLTEGRDQARQTNASGLIAPYTQATRLLRDPSAREDPFLKALANFNDSNMVSGTFKFRDLLQLDPNAESDQVCKINMRDFNAYKNQRGENMSMGTDTSHWNGQDMPTQWAVQLTNILPPMMMDLGMRRVELFASNLHRERICKSTHAVPFVPGVDLSPQMATLDLLFYEQFISPLTGNGQWHSYTIDVVADLRGDLVINISIDGGPMYPYVMPAFMSSAMAPVLTSKSDTLDHVARQFYDLQANVTPAIDPLITDLANQAIPSGRRY